MKKRKFAAGGYLPNYGDEQPQNPFGPSVINPTGQDMGLPSMGNPYDPYEQGYRHGGKVKMAKKKMAVGGPIMRGNAPIRPDLGLKRTPVGGRVEPTPQQEAMAAKNKGAFESLMGAKSQFGSGVAGAKSPERLHYEKYLAEERRRMQGTSGAYSPLKYDPKATYRGYTRPTGMADGGAIRRQSQIDPERQKFLANKAAFNAAQAAGKPFAIGTPERQAHRAYIDMERDKYKAAMGPGRTPMSTYTPAAFNPSGSYVSQLAQQRAAADAAKKAADAARGAGRGMAKGGMASSASKRADGCAVKGKTKGRMR